MTSALPDFIHALLDPAVYAARPDRVDLVQTHISYVLLAGDHVYKIKKPLALGFLDFSTLDRRRHFCEEEVRLNSRLCAGLYFGVEPVVKSDAGYRLGGSGSAVEYAVHMRRLPANGMMDGLLARDAISLEKIGRLADRMVRFHAGAVPGREAAAAGGFDAFASHWRENFTELEPYIGQTISRRRFERLRAFAEDTLCRQEGFLRRRGVEGRIKDGHGDLRCESVCFDFPETGAVCISDCIEFGEAYRVSDAGLDIGFLAMDLDARGRPDLADLLIGLYCAASADVELPVALPGFKSYRAAVRGKVKTIEAFEAEVPAKERARARREAGHYFRLAESYVRSPHRPFLVLVRGLSGSGKSVLAGALAARFAAVLLTTDVTRKQLFGQTPTEHSRAEFGGGIYAAEATERVYAELAAETGRQLTAGRPVVADGTFLRRGQRALVLAAAQSVGVRTLIVECWAPEDVIERRQRSRLEQEWTTSDAGWEIYQRQKGLEETITSAEGRAIRVDTSLPLKDQTDRIASALRAGRPLVKP
jgi:aminoglycoside phosphotransferase family enzyme/predicted kinase